MKYEFYIKRGDRLHVYSLLPFGDLQRIDVDGIVIIDIFKYHNHRYDFKAFFYQTKSIYSFRSFESKRELYGAIQKLLQENLHDNVQ